GGRRSTTRIKRQVARVGACAQLAPEFVLLPGNEIGAELQAVLSDNFVDVIAIGIGRIRIVWTIWDVARILAKAATAVRGPLVHKIDSWQHTSVRAGEDRTEGGISQALVVADIRKTDVIGRIAKHKLV